MANRTLFNTQTVALPATDTINRSGAAAYAYTPKHRLAQLAMTGCLNSTFYANAETQLTEVLARVAKLEPEFVARAALYSRHHGHMKDMPALLLAALSIRSPALLALVFPQVVDNGKMLRNVVQILRSGVTGRKSLGTRPKKLVQAWLNSASERQLLQAMVGNQPSLADVVKMVHPKPAEAWRAAFFAWLIGKPCDATALPPLTQALLAFRTGATTELPDVPFQLLSNEALTAEHWARLAHRMGWQALRQNLNTLARHGAFELPGITESLARRLADPAAIAKARVYPYQLLAAYRMIDAKVPEAVREALQAALDVALARVPRLPGQVVVCPDVSGSMGSPVTGYRKGAGSTVSCVDVAALVAAALLRVNPGTRVLPFEQCVVPLQLNARDSVLTNAQKLAAIGGGGTNCSAPLAQLVQEGAKVDMVILVSDNESWIDAKRRGATETQRQWQRLKQHNPGARLVCIDLQPYGSTQAQERADILNIGGFGDAVFDVIAQFASGQYGAGHWVKLIEAIEL